MSQELGKIDKANTEDYKNKRKLFMVPIIFTPFEPNQDAEILITKYWNQVKNQINSLIQSLGIVKHIFHETLSVGGHEGLEQLKNMNSKTYSFVQEQWESGAEIHVTEDLVSLTEMIDLQRIANIPFSSEGVRSKIESWYSEVAEKRFSAIRESIDSKIKSDEIGLLLMSENHNIEFPEDIEVIHVSPPALHDFRRWLDDFIQEQMKMYSQAKENTNEEN